MTSRAKRSGRIVPSALRARAGGSPSAAAPACGGVTAGGSPRWSSTIAVDPLARLVGQLGGPSTRACSRRPSAHEISSRGFA